MSWSRFAPAAVLCLALLGSPAAPALAQTDTEGVIYAPIYQEAIIDHRGRKLDLAATLYVRNLSRQHPLKVETITLYDGRGQMVKQCLAEAKRLAPLGTLRLLAPQAPAKGGTPSLLVRWSSAQPVPLPLVEVLMMGTAGQQGISLTSQGIPLDPEP